MKKIISLVVNFIMVQELYSSQYNQSSIDKNASMSIVKQNTITTNSNNFNKNKSLNTVQAVSTAVVKSSRGQSGCSSQIKPISKAIQKTPYEKILEEQKVPEGMTVKDAEQLLQEKLKKTYQVIDAGLSFKSGAVHKLFGQEIAVGIDHIVNIIPEVKAGRFISLQGGHKYETLEAFNNEGFLKNSYVSRDQTTNCWLFDGVDVITGARFYKTTFPKGWSSQDIYESIVKATLVKKDPTFADRLVMKIKVKYKNNPEFVARLALYKRSDSNTWEIMTAFPEYSVNGVK